MAEPSGLRSSTVWLFSKALRSSAGSLGLASRTMRSPTPTQPRGTRTSTERFRSPQQMLVGASWWGTRRRKEVGTVLPKAVRDSALMRKPAMTFLAVSVRPLLVGHHVHAVLHEARVDVHAAARLAHDDLGGEAHLQAVLVGHLPHGPLGHDQLVRGVLDGHRQELDLVLHHLQVAADDVAHFGMAVLDHAAHLADDAHGLAAHEAPLREGVGLVVALLLGDRVDPVHFREQVVLQLAQGLHGQARCAP